MAVNAFIPDSFVVGSGKLAGASAWGRQRSTVANGDGGTVELTIGWWAGGGNVPSQVTVAVNGLC